MTVKRAFFAWSLLLPALFLFYPAPAMAQGMTSGVDLSTKAFTAAEMTRADVEALIAARQPGAGLDLPDKSLNGLDLSGLDLSKANLRGSRLIGARLAGRSFPARCSTGPGRSRPISPAPTFRAHICSGRN